MCSMPNEVKQLENGKLEVKLETGEVFTGDPLEVTNKMAAAHVETKRWGQGFRDQLETLKNQPPVPPAAPPVPTPDPNEAVLQNYLLEQTAKALGFSSGAEYKQRMEVANRTIDNLTDQDKAASFMYACPEFPNDQEAIDKLGKKIDELGWDFTPQSMIAAHSLC